MDLGEATTPSEQLIIRIKRWISDHPNPTARELASAGLVAPHWPIPWGLNADVRTQLLIDEALGAACIRRPRNLIGIGWAGPTLLVAGTEQQRQRYLPPLLEGKEQWCQLFSEPEAGSDLASLRTTAERVKDGYVIRGQKVWTSMAHESDLGILLARTDIDAPKQKGISYFICPMDSPGVSIRPIVDMTGKHSFNQVFLDDVFIPNENLVGQENDGWRLAKVTLENERVVLSRDGAIWGRGPTAADLIDLARYNHVSDSTVRQNLAKVFIEGEILRFLRLRLLASQLGGQQSGPEASIRKLFADQHGATVLNLARDLAGPYGMLANTGPFRSAPGQWYFGFLFSPALTIGGGTSQVQRNIIAESILDLPREPRTS